MAVLQKKKKILAFQNQKNLSIRRGNGANCEFGNNANSQTLYQMKFIYSMVVSRMIFLGNSN